MSERGAASCLCPGIIGNSRGVGAPGTPKGTAAEREKWLEDEVERLRTEADRLEEVNDSMRTEIFFKESTPKTTRSKMSQWFKEKMEQGEAVSPSAIHSAKMVERQMTGITEAGDDGEGPLQGKIMQDRIKKDAEHIEEDMGSLAKQASTASGASGLFGSARGSVTSARARAGAASNSLPGQYVIYAIALGAVVFVLLATAFHLGAPDHGGGCGSASGAASGAASGSSSGCASGSASAMLEDEDDHGRRLGGAVSPLMKNLAFTLTMAGLVSIVMNFLKQQLILGYLLSGILIGPLCLNIVENPMEIADLSSLGLIFLLFMIGLELDVKQALQMGKKACLVGFLQLPICAAVMTLIFLGLESAGLSFGTPGGYGAVYCGVTAGLSSTMIVIKFLDFKGELDSQSGRFTLAVLIWQDVWAIVLLAIQTNLPNPTVGGIAFSFGMIAILVIVALAYAKFVMPAVLFYASKSVELMLVMSLAWCFFICCAAILPFVRLPMEMAALIAGIALATFPYSTEFNAKIKYIRDFFFTVFFAGLGMMLPAPQFQHVMCAIVISLVVLMVRPLGIFVPAWFLRKTPRLCAYTTLNLSQLSEFTLVICSLGVANGHIDEATLNIVIIAFAILAVAASYIMDYKHAIFSKTCKIGRHALGLREGVDSIFNEDDEDDGQEREILLLGFHKIAFLLVGEVHAKSPELMSKFHVIDFNTNIMPKLREMGIKCTYGDIASATLMKHARKGMNPPRIVMSTIPDTLLQGISNQSIVETAKKVWPDTHCIALADDPQTAKKLYEAGASYVVRMAKLSAERLHILLNGYAKSDAQKEGDISGIMDLFKRYKDEDNARQTDFTSNKLHF